MKRYFRFIMVLLIISIILIPISSNAAINPEDYNPGQLVNAGKLSDIGGKILGIIQNIGIFLGVIVICIIGIKYMLGSVEEKAQYKETMIPFIVGAILLMIFPTIVNVIYNFAKK